LERTLRLLVDGTLTPKQIHLPAVGL